jgi:hypothetical protein
LGGKTFMLDSRTDLATLAPDIENGHLSGIAASRIQSWRDPGVSHPANWRWSPV